MKKLFIFLFLTIFSLISFSQKKTYHKEFSLADKTPVFVSYYGNLVVHPGIKAGLEYSLYFKEKTKDKKRVKKTIRKNLLLSPSIAYYSHKNSHKGLFISGDLIWRRYTKRLFIHDISFGIGYYQRFNSGITYENTPNGIKEVGSTSRGYFTPSLAYSFGKRVQLKEIPSEFFVRTNFNPIFNYNSSISAEISCEFGLRMNLDFGFTQKQQKAN